MQSNQCWIDQQHLYLVRTITKTKDNHLQDAQFRKHVKVGGGWSETEVLFLNDDQKQQLEEYKNIQPNPSLPAGLFQWQQFGKVHWLKQ